MANTRFGMTYSGGSWWEAERFTWLGRVSLRPLLEEAVHLGAVDRDARFLLELQSDVLAEVLDGGSGSAAA